MIKFLRVCMIALTISTTVLSFWGLYQTVNFIINLREVIVSRTPDTEAKLVNFY